MKSNQNNLFRRLCSSEILLRAWKTIKAKGSVGGVDGISLLEFEHNLYGNLQQLAEDLRTNRWKPLPYKHVEIPKKDGETRRLGMLSLRDKIVQHAIKILIEPRCERLFLGCSYGYRPGRSALKAVRRLVANGRRKELTFALRLDIDDFFDSVNHDILASRLSAILIGEPEILRLLMLSVSMGCISTAGRWVDTYIGVPQGAVLSPVLSNIYLHSFDQFMLSRTPYYVRYADDFVVLCESCQQAHALCDEITTYLGERLKLRLNPAQITSLDSVGYDFLGVHINRDGVSISQAKKIELEQRICSLEISETGISGRSVRSWDGFRNYYSQLLSQDLLSGFDKALVSRIKSVITGSSRIFQSKKSLSNFLATISFLSKEYNINRKTIIASLIDDYALAKGALSADAAKEENRRIIDSRRLEYRRKEVEVSQLIVSRPGMFVGLTRRGVTVKEKGNLVDVVPLNNLSHIIITGKGVSLSSNLLEYCAANRIPVDFFDGNGAHVGTFLSSKSTQNVLWRLQALASVSQRNRLAALIVSGKIKNQSGLIKYFHKYHKSRFPHLETAYLSLLQCVERFKIFLKDSDATSEDYITRLMGHEAQVAIRYWDYIKELLVDDNVSFVGRHHRGATDVVNCMLNYGYSILYSRVWRALLAAGINPHESVIHVRREGKPAFVYDVVEIFRAQAVDRVVVSMIQKGGHLRVSNGMLNDDTKKTLTRNILARLCRYENYRGVEKTLDDIILSQAREVALFYSENKNFKPYISKW